MTDATDLLNAKEVAAILKCSVRQAYRTMEINGVDPKRPTGVPGGMIRWQRGDVDAVARGLANAGKQKPRVQPDARPYEEAS